MNAGRDGGVLVKCHANCPTTDVVAALGLTMADLSGAPHITATYDYVSEDGKTLWVVERWANPKTFRCRPGLPPPAERVLYRSDWLAYARRDGETIYVTEGERDCERLVSLGYVATTNVGGAGSWLPHYAQQLRGFHVIVVADADAPGRQHARDVAASCATEALSVTTLVPRYGKDVSEMLDAGWTMDALDPLPESEELGFILASNVRCREVEWAWSNYIPLGSVTILEGDPGDGKSITTTDLAARWSSGARMPDDSRHKGPYDVAMISAEDDVETTIGPRLRAAGADMGRVHLLTHGSDPSRPFTFGTDTPALARYLRDHGIKILFLDPLMAFVGDDVDSHNDHAVRRALWPLYRLAQDSGVAIVVVRHLNKGSGGKAIYRGGGSIAFVGNSRAAYTIGKDPDDPARRVLASVKMNIAPTPASLSFSVESGHVGPFIKWHGVIDADAQAIVDGRRSEDDPDILEFLNKVVDAEPMTWKQIVKEGSAEGWTEKQLRSRRHRSRLVKVVGRDGNRSTQWGYLSHQMEADNHLPASDLLPPLTPSSPLSLSGQIGADGPGGSDVGSPAHALPGRESGKDAESGESGTEAGKWQAADGDVDDGNRLRELEARPLVCEVCSSEVTVARYADPWWVIRCLAHSPMFYAGD